MKYALMTLGAVAAMTFTGSGAFAQIPQGPADIIFAVDSHGHGLAATYFGIDAMPSFIASDPGPGGNTTALTYSLERPPSIVTGDVFLDDPSGTYYPGLIRFNASDASDTSDPNDPGVPASFVFYSAENGIASGPTDFYQNQRHATIYPGGPAYYEPSAGDPGYIAGFTVDYVFLNDAIAPEPSALAALGFGVLGVAMLAFKARRRRTFSV